MDISLRVRDRYFIRLAVERAYPTGRVASRLPPRGALVALVEAAWETRTASSKEVVAGITSAVSRLVGLFKRAPEAWAAIKRGLGLEDASLPNLVRGIKDAMAEGKRALMSVLHKATSHLPLSLFFIDQHKMPGLTDLIRRLVKDVPWLQRALSKIREGAETIDNLFRKHIPTLRRPVYAAIYIYVWISVLEITWDIPGIVAGFTGGISLVELLASMPESAIGGLFAQLGFGTFAALPITLVLRLAWLVAKQYLEYKPGHGFTVRWDRLGVENRSDETVPA